MTGKERSTVSEGGGGKTNEDFQGILDCQSRTEEREDLRRRENETTQPANDVAESIAVDESVTDAGVIVCEDDRGPRVHTSDVVGPTRITDIDVPIPMSQSHYATKVEHKETKSGKSAVFSLMSAIIQFLPGSFT